jgi:DNA-binding response OmpR family regulator
MLTSPPVTVLVVDDEPDVCWALETLLRRNGVTVVTVGGGVEALRWLKESTTACRLILLDAKLADIEGVELARRIRAETSFTGPVILVSGYFYKDDSIVKDNLRTGLISAFVTKPVHHDELLKTIHAVLSTEQVSH